MATREENLTESEDEEEETIGKSEIICKVLDCYNNNGD